MRPRFVGDAFTAGVFSAGSPGPSGAGIDKKRAKTESAAASRPLVSHSKNWQ